MLFIKIIACTLTQLIDSLENVETFSRNLLCSLVERACTFDRQCLLKISMSSTPLLKTNYGLSGFYLLQLEKWFKGRNVMWVIRSMCLKVSFSKVIFRSLNLLPKSWDFLRSGEKRPYCRLWRRSKNICLQPVMGGVLSIFAPVDKNADIL